MVYKGSYRMLNYIESLRITKEKWERGDHNSIKFIRYMLDELQNLWYVYTEDQLYSSREFEELFFAVLFDMQECEEVNE